MNAVLNSFFGSGSVFVILGMIGVILGVILLICGIVRKNTNVVRGNRVVEQMGIDCPLCRFVNSPNRTTCEGNCQPIILKTNPKEFHVICAKPKMKLIVHFARAAASV